MPRAKRATHESIPATMRAAAIDRFGGPSVLKLHELPTPTPEPEQVLIAIHTAGVGTWDAEIRDGSWRKPGRPRFPRRRREGQSRTAARHRRPRLGV